MKKSKYILLSKLTEDEYIINNMITNSIALLNKNEYNNFSKIINSPQKYKYLDPNLYKYMKDEGFLIPENINELDLAKKYYWNAKLNRTQLYITIIPTLDCNFKCVYCYQHGSNTCIINKESTLKIYKFIKSKIEGISQLNINWFGGEALLQINFMEKFSTKLIKLCNIHQVKYTSSISTNGYLLTKENISILKKIQVNYINTTLAGTEKIHNTLRPTKKNEPTFSTIINNIKCASKYFKLLISINVTKTNINSLYTLLDFAKQHELINNISFCFDPIVSYKSNPCEKICLQDHEFNKHALALYKYSLDIGLNICDVTKFDQNFVYCGADYDNTYTLDFNANVYKCTEFYDESNRIGYIDENGNLKKTSNNVESLKDPFNDSICSDCEILPYCYGGCTTKRRCNKMFCPLEKDTLSQYLKLYYLKHLHINS